MLRRLSSSLLAAQKGSQALLVLGTLIAVFTAIASLLRLPPNVLAGGFFLLSFAFVGVLLRKLRFDYGTVLIVLAGLVLYLAYLSYTSLGERNYDGPEQLRYIQYIAEHRSLPQVEYCFICHHPPLYYIVSAVGYVFFQRSGVVEPVRGLQLMALVMSLGLVIYGVLLVRRFTTDPRLVRLAAALIMFWPYAVHNCVRIHNDTLVSALMVAALYYIVRWAQDHRPRDLYVATAVSAAALLTKSNAYILVAIIGLLLAWRLLKSRDRLRHVARSVAVLAALLGTMAVSSIGKGKVPEKVSVTEGSLCERVLGSACRMNNQEVGNEPFNYIYLDLEIFLKEPYVLSAYDRAGRQFFWNHLLKSSLLGTHNKVADRETAYELNATVASFLGVLLLGLTGYLLLALAWATKSQARRHGVILLSLVCFMTFMMGFRILIPWTHHSDFRHVFPIIVPMALLYVQAVGAFRRRESVLEWVGIAMAVAMVGLSAFYWWPKYDWAMRWTARTVSLQLEDYSTIVREGTPWDKDTNLMLEGNHTLDFKVRGLPTAAELDITVDNNDVYELKLYGEGGERTLHVGPSDKPVKGLRRFVETLDPPVERVRRITMRAVSGDRAYSMGHLVLR